MSRSTAVPQYAAWSIARPTFLAAIEAIGRVARHSAVAVVRWRERARERHILAGLTDRELRDIGVTRVEVWREVSKPFWRE